MPFVPRIRRDILDALNEYVIPALRAYRVPLGYIAPPLKLPEEIHCQLESGQIPPQDGKNFSFLEKARWSTAKLHSTKYSYLTFVYGGEIEERTLISKEDAAIYSINPGVYSLRATAPSVLYFPVGAPYKTGLQRFNYKNTSRLRVLRISIWDDIRVHTRSEIGDQWRVSHPLSITDSSLLTLANLFENLLEDSLTEQQDVVRAVLLAFMLQLRNQITLRSTHLANMSSPSIMMPPLKQDKHEAYQRAIHFIQTHLHKTLTVADISEKANISPTQLNRYFRKFANMSVMAYVKKQRIKAAKVMLKANLEGIAEISILLGYKRTSSFCAAFRKETGMTPLQYKKKNLTKK